MINDNIILLSDSYKASHAKQYPPNTSNIYSYFESRGGEFEEVVFFGLQYLIKRYLAGQVVTQEKINEASIYFADHFGNSDMFYRKGWEYILEKHDGRLPIEIKAVPEGMPIKPRNVMMTVENTDPQCWWLTNYVETLLVQCWYTSTVATISREMKKAIKSGLKRSADDLLGLQYKLHDFGCRGSTSMESAAMGGAAHLVNFSGSDTLPAIQFLREYYGHNMAGVSIPAAEHSTITSWGEASELEAYKNMLEQFPTGPVAVVSDSWDIYEATKRLWGRELKEAVLARDGTVVIRPDSGDPRKVVPALLRILDTEFGGAYNDKGYRMLPPQVRVIQGDGINRRTLSEIIDAVLEAGYSLDNVVFGSGGGLLQDCNRDTCQFAFKCSSAVVNGQQRDVFKRPATMPSKNSKKGRLRLLSHPSFVTPTNGSEYMTVTDDLQIPDAVDMLNVVFRDGKLMSDQTLADVRQRARLK